MTIGSQSELDLYCVSRKEKTVHADHICRRAPLVHTPAGKEIGEKLWDEVLKDCLRVDGKLEGLPLLDS